MRSSPSRRRLRAAVLLASCATFAACAAPDDGATPPGVPAPPLARNLGLRATLSLPAAAFTADEQAIATVTITNVSTHPERVLGAYAGDDALAAPLLAVWRDGAAVAYRGPRVKRATPAADDFVTLAPGAAITRRIDLADAYDLGRSGDYTVRVQVASSDLRGAPGADARWVVSPDGSFWAEGRAAVVTAERPGPTCDATQQSLLAQATAVATTMASGARSYLATTPPSATSRYVTWFGAFSAAGWGTASAHFDAIADAFATQTVTFDCKCKQKNVYAYVSPNAPYLIHLCGAFWQAPMSGTDSKGGTLVHEMSHFTVTAGTSDWAYGQAACKSLALSDPARALDNADSHEYFAENTPALP